MGLGKYAEQINSSNTEGVEMVILDPLTKEPVLNSEGKKMKLLLVGKDSKHFKRVKYEVDGMRRAEGAQGSDITAAKLDKWGVMLLARCTIGFINVEIDDGVPTEYEDWKQVEKLYSADGWGWLTDQVDAFVNNRVNFLGNSAAG